MKFRSVLALLPCAFLTFACGQKNPAAATEVKPTPSPAESSVASAAAAPAAQSDGAPSGGGNGDRPRRQGGQGGPGGGNPAERAKQRLEEMQTNLGLTAEQTEKVKAVYESQRPAMEALRNDQSLSREQRREKLDEMRKATDAQIAPILTPEQKTKWEELRKQRREQMGNRQRGGGSNPPPPSN